MTARRPTAAGANGLALATVETFEGNAWCYDAETFVRSLPSESVDLVVTSPPYNLRNSTGNGLKGTNDKSLWSNQPMRYGYQTYTDDMPHDEYIAWQRRILVECMRVIPDTGAIFYNHKWRVQDGLLQRLADDITAGFPVRQIIIWDRGGGFNFNRTYFVPSYEVVYLIAKPGFTLVEGANGLKDVWSIAPVQNKQHPNSFPEELVRRCIASTSAKIVLDPFCGVGTTLWVAQSLGRKYLGCDISEQYVELARKRLALPYAVPLFSEVA